MKWIAYLEKTIKSKEERAAWLRGEIKAAETADEVRELGDTLQSVLDELMEAKEQLADAQTKENESSEGTDDMGERSKPISQQEIPVGAQLRNGRILGSYFTRESSEGKDEEKGFASMEYRTAFKDYVQNGTQIPQEILMRAESNESVTVTDDIGYIIPTTIAQEFIEKASKVRGNIYSKVRKLNVKGGIQIPISDLKAQFRWIGEREVSPEQKAGDIKDAVSFGYHTGEIRLATSLLAQVVSLDIFEEEIVKIMVKAFLEAMDKVIIHGTGNEQPLGIVKDPRVTNVVNMSAKDFTSWTAWRKKLFAKIPLSQRGLGEFLFPESTVESCLLTMQDANGNPIFREPNTPDATFGVSAGKFYGRNTELVEPDVIGDFETAAVGDLVGVYWRPEDYAINTNLTFGMRRYFDEGKNVWMNKALVILDGKILDPSGCYLIKKAAASS